MDNTPRSGLSDRSSGMPSTAGGRSMPPSSSKPNMNSARSNQAQIDQQMRDQEMDDLAKLQESHEQEKQKAAMIRENMGGVSAH